MNGYGPFPRSASRARLTLLLIFTVFVLLQPTGLVLADSGSGTGPGGVDRTDGIGSLVLWLQADALTGLADGDPLAAWPDSAGSGNSLNQTTLSRQPTFKSDAASSLNSRPVVQFDGSDLLSSSSNITAGPFTIILVFNATAHGVAYEFSSGNAFNPITTGNEVYTAAECTILVNRGGLRSAKSASAAWGIGGVTRLVTHAFAGTHASHQLRVDSQIQTLSDCLALRDDPGTAMTTQPLSLGALPDGSFALTGNMAEVIFYNRPLNGVELILVENYLAAKYGLDISASGHDRYGGDSAAAGSFDRNVAGIGRDHAHSHTAAHAAGMIVRNNSFLADAGDWLLFGHNVAANGNSTADLPTAGDWAAGRGQRWLRHWYIDVTDETSGQIGGTVDILFDFSAAGMNGVPIGSADNYRLLKRADAGGPFVDVAVATALAGDRVIFDGVEVSLLGSSFTLGTVNADISPTAVALQSLSARAPTGRGPEMALGLVALVLGAVGLVTRHRRARVGRQP